MLLHLQRQQPVVVIGSAESRHRAVPIVCQVPRGAGQALGVGLGVFTEDAVLQVEANGCQVVAESLVQQLQLLQVAGVEFVCTVECYDVLCALEGAGGRGKASGAGAGDDEVQGTAAAAVACCWSRVFHTVECNDLLCTLRGDPKGARRGGRQGQGMMRTQFSGQKPTASLRQRCQVVPEQLPSFACFYQAP